jgi:hypothetical protein
MQETDTSDPGDEPPRLPVSPNGLVEADASHTPEPSAEAIAEVVELFVEAGGSFACSRALLDVGSPDDVARLARIRRHMQVVFDRDTQVYATRNAELAYLANVLMAGCSVQGRPFTEQEAMDAAVAVCNLGLEHWPAPAAGLSDDVLLTHDLIAVFQAGWTVLHRDVGICAAERLIDVLARFRCSDRDIQISLTRLRLEMTKHLQTGEPWRAPGALEAIAMLDMPAWATLLGLIAECPVLPAAIAASQGPRALSVSATAFEFISESRQIAAVRTFLRGLARTLTGR